MQGLACRQACRDADEAEFVIGFKNDVLDGYSGESATQLMRQLVVPMQWVNVKGKRVLRLQFKKHS
jgi:hypothetical protein